VTSVDRSTSPSEPSFLQGGGETTALIQSFDWSATPLGPIDHWPQSLKTATALLLRSPVPIVMLWGPEGVMIYNDAYSVFAGGRHPQLLGTNVREGWPEVADFNDNVMKIGLAGGTLAYKDQELTLHRTGQPEQVWMNLDYWPVPDESGAPAGVICTVVETTERVKADAALRESEARLRALNVDLEREVLHRTRERGRQWEVTPDLLSVLTSGRGGRPAPTPRRWRPVGQLTGGIAHDFNNLLAGIAAA
jgi:PAS domain S-box-containing protein